MIVLQKLKDKDYQEWIQLNEFKEVKGVPLWPSLRMDARADTAVGQVSLTPSEVWCKQTHTLMTTTAPHLWQGHVDSENLSFFLNNQDTSNWEGSAENTIGLASSEGKFK